jgi:hypothetical protein
MKFLKFLLSLLVASIAPLRAQNPNVILPSSAVADFMEAVDTGRYPADGCSEFDYAPGKFSKDGISYDCYGFVWRKTGGGLTLIQALPFTLSETRTYESSYNFDYLPPSPVCKPLTASGLLFAGSYTAANFIPHPCIVAQMPDGGEIDIHIKIEKL